MQQKKARGRSKILCCQKNICSFQKMAKRRLYKSKNGQQVVLKLNEPADRLFTVKFY